MLPQSGRDYIVNNLDHAPVTISALLARFPATDAIWNTQPDPDRFSLREVVAHLADWEPIFRNRFERVVNEDYPHLLRPNLDERAAEQGYATADPQECLARFQERRSALTPYLRTLPDSAWTRIGLLDRMGDVSLEGFLSLVISHDAYHIRQISEYLSTASHGNG